MIEAKHWPLRVVHLMPMALSNHSPTSGIIAQIRQHDHREVESELWSFYPAPAGRSPLARLSAVESRYRVMSQRRDPVDSHVLLPLARQLRESRPDVLHCHFVRANLYGRLAARVSGVPVVISTLRGVDEYLTEARIASRVVRFAERATLGLVSRYVTVSEAVRRNAIAQLGISPERIVTILNALDLEPFVNQSHSDRAEVRRELELDGDAIVIASVGVLRPLKNHQLAIRMMSELRNWTKQRLHLVIVGEGDDRSFLQRMVVDLGLEDCVRITGLISDVPRLLRAVDVSVLFSLSEGLPRAIMEAMASGIPCVVSDTGGMAEAVVDGQTGFVRALTDLDGIRDALLRLIEQPSLRDQLGRAGREVAFSRFSPVRLASEYEALYRSLLPVRGVREYATSAGRDPGCEA